MLSLGVFIRDKKYIIQLYLEIDCYITYALNLQMKELVKQWKNKKKRSCINALLIFLQLQLVNVKPLSHQTALWGHCEIRLKISNLPVIACTQCSHSVPTTSPWRSDSVFIAPIMLLRRASSCCSVFKVPFAFIIINLFYDYWYFNQNAMHCIANAYSKYKIYTASLERACGMPTTSTWRSQRPYSAVTAFPQCAV